MTATITGMATATTITTRIEAMMAAAHDPGSAQARLIAVVLVLTAVLWLGVNYLGSQMDWPPKFIFLADLSAGAAYLWALVATARLWRKRQA